MHWKHELLLIMGFQEEIALICDLNLQSMEILTQAPLKSYTQNKPNDTSALLNETRTLVAKIDTVPISKEVYWQVIEQYSLVLFGDWYSIIDNTGTLMSFTLDINDFVEHVKKTSLKILARLSEYSEVKDKVTVQCTVRAEYEWIHHIRTTAYCVPASRIIPLRPQVFPEK